MIGIYQDTFVKYIEDNLGYVKTSSKNIITKCPWCEFKKDKSHYHMYISLEAPIFHCFHATCEKSGTIRKLLKKIEGHDISDTFIDKEKLKEFNNQREVFVDKDKKVKHLLLPDLKTDIFPNKELYIKKRFKFANIPTSQVKGLIYDVYEFIRINQIPIDETLFRLQDYIHNNFVGFLTEHETTVIFRNIDPTHSMKFYKLKIQYNNLLDYYALKGNNPLSKKIVLAEGIFDIFSENIFDHLQIKDDVKLYASALSSKYLPLIHSIVFYEQVFKPEIIILSDRGIPIEQYQTMKKFNRHIIDKLTVYYNKSGKDFNDTPLNPVKYVIR